MLVQPALTTHLLCRPVSIADCMDVGVREILKKPIGLDLLDKVVKSYLTNEKRPIHQEHK